MSATTSRSVPGVGADHEAPRARRGVPPKPIIDFPDPIAGGWSDPPAFAEALALHMDRHGDTTWHLHRAVSAPGEPFQRTTIRDWRAGSKAPRSAITEETIASLCISFNDIELEIWRTIAVRLARTHPDAKRYSCLPTADMVR